MRLIGGRVGQVALLAWVLWAQPHSLLVVNDKVMVNPVRDGVWRYTDAFDAKTGCVEARTKRLTEQETWLATLTATSDLSKASYKEYVCYPESIDPTATTRGGDGA